MAEQAAAVNEPVVADTTQTDSAPVEDESAVTDIEDDLKAFDDDFDDEPSDGTDNKPDAPPEKEAEPPVDETQINQPQGEEKPLSPKSENRFQQLANQNNELKAEIEQLRMREAQFATEQDLLNEVNPETGDYYTPQEVERIAFQQSREAQQQQIAQQRYELEVQQNQQTLSTEMDRAMNDFPMFNPKSPEYAPEIAQQVSAALLKAAIVDENGILLGSNLNPYEYLQTIATASQLNAAKQQAMAQRATETMLANADVPGGRSDPPSKDTDIDDFDKGWDN